MPCTNLIIESSNLSKLDKKFSDKLKTFCFVKTVSTVKLSLTFAKDFAILALFFSHWFIINPYKNLLILFFFSLAISTIILKLLLDTKFYIISENLSFLLLNKLSTLFPFKSALSIK